ncbi:MAG TPA: cardiolipin synthase ClsB [Cellvibrio sp.]|nr:cardiolipin synthase ClsB [Cellvibrio sp.]
MKDNWREGNDVKLLINGDEFYPRVFECIRNAKEEILLETFIVYEDEVGHQLQQELIAAAKRGVSIDITVDDYGTWDLSPEFTDALAAAGVRLHIFDPQPKLWGVRLNLFRRLHRKLIVIDRELAFVGGINFSFDHLLRSGAEAKQDYAVEVRGPVVADIHQTCMLLLLRASTRKERRQYIENARAEAPEPVGNMRALIVERDNGRHSKDIERHYLLAARLAQKRLVIANAYFFPGYRLLREFRRAAQRNVEVILILQGQPDMPWVTALSRLLYNYLLRSGVKVYEYCKRPLHGKVALMDDKWATVGSSNLDPLSLALNLEANIIIEDAEFNQHLYEHLSELVEKDCKQLDRETVARGLWWRAPIIFLSFHFLRRFPTIMGWLPAHAHELKLVTTSEDYVEKKSNDSANKVKNQKPVKNQAFKPKKNYDRHSLAKESVS